MYYLSSRFILKQQVSSPNLKIDWNFFRTSFQTLQYAKSLPLIFMILLGNSWYWFYGATSQLKGLTAGRTRSTGPQARAPNGRGQGRSRTLDLVEATPRSPRGAGERFSTPAPEDRTRSFGPLPRSAGKGGGKRSTAPRAAGAKTRQSPTR